MLWNKDLLFLHIPKTAGKSLTKAFVQTLERPVTCFVSKGQIQELADCDQTGLTIRQGLGHEDMETTGRILAEYDKPLDSFKVIVVGLRNPYDMMVSTYFFMRKTYEDNRDRINFQIAVENNFEDFAVKAEVVPLESWMTIAGKRPSNLWVIRYEDLQKDFDRLAEEFGFKSIKLPHLNPSSHDHYLKYLTERSEIAIYNKFKYLFDNGFYPRQYFSLKHRIKATARNLLSGSGFSLQEDRPS